MLDYLGIIFVLFLPITLIHATNVDIFSVYNDEEANQINPHNIKQSSLSFPHESFELFPFFNELFPLREFNGKSSDIHSKENVKNRKDIFLDKPFLETSHQLRDEKKKIGKDKLIMSFTELFIPFQKQRSQSQFNLKKKDVFEDIFNNFPFPHFDNLHKHDQLLKKSRLKKKTEGLIKVSNSTSRLNRFLENDEFKVTPMQPIITHFEPNFVHVPNSLMLFTNMSEDKSDCDDHQTCDKGHCSTNFKYNEVNNESLNLNKKSLLMDKTFLMCVIPGLIGLGALIFGIEVLRRHNELVKRTPFLSQYNQVQSC